MMNPEVVPQANIKSNHSVALSAEGVFARPFTYSNVQKAVPASTLALPTSDNSFIRFANAGYSGRLLPIVQPGADISPRSSLSRRERQKDIGKAPGVRGADGLWRGLGDWQKLESTAEQHEAWGAMGAGVGMKMGDGLIAVDIDVADKALSEKCGTTATEVMGASANRVGRSPRRAKLYRTSEAVPYQRVVFDGGAVEILSDGKQLVVHGIHPLTGRPYEWERGLPRFGDLPVVSAAQVSAYMAKLAERLPTAKIEVSALAVDRHTAPEQLAGKVEDVRRAVAALPNTYELFRTYGKYVEVAQAIKGALPDDPETGLELFQQWATKYVGPAKHAPNHERAAADWGRTQPSRSLGAQWLYAKAAAYGAGDFTEAETWFEGAPAVLTGEEGDGWPEEPVDLFGDGDASALMDVPAGALPDVVERYSRDVADRMGAPVAFIALGAIVTASAAIGGRLRIQPKANDTAWTTPPFLWGALVENPGGRKSPVISEVIKPLRNVDDSWSRSDLPKRQAWEIENKKRKKDAAAAAPRPKLRRAMVNSFTAESLRDVLADNARGVLVAVDEVTGLICGLDQYKSGGGSDRADLLELTDGHPRTIDRVGRSIRVECWGASVLGGIQPRKIAEMAKSLAPDGLLQRFIPIVGDGVRREGVDRAPDEAAMHDYRSAIKGLAETADYANLFDEAVVTLSHGAQEVRRRFDRRTDTLMDLPNVSDAWLGHLNKWSGNFARLLLVFHMLDNWSAHGQKSASIPVSTETAERTWRFAQFLLSHAIVFYETIVGRGPAGESARTAAGVLLVLDKQTVTARDIYRKHRAWQPDGAPHEMFEGMRALCRLGWCAPESTAGGAPESWKVNPRVFSRFKERTAAEVERRQREYARVQAAVAERRQIKASARIAPCEDAEAFQ